MDRLLLCQILWESVGLFFYAHLYKHINIYILIDTSRYFLTFHTLCYIIRHVKKEGHMPKRIKKLLSILCIILVAFSLLSFFVAATSAFHVCKRTSCPICRFMDMVSDLEKHLNHSRAAAQVMLAVLVFIRLITITMNMDMAKTPVELMVRMNN